MPVLATCMLIFAPAGVEAARLGSTAQVRAVPITASAVGSVCTTATQYAQPSPTRPRYDIELDLDTVSGRVRGRSVVTFTPDLDIRELVVRLWPNRGVRGAGAPSITVDSVLVEPGSGALSSPDATTLVITLAQPVRAGQQVVLTMVWTLVVPGPSDDRISRGPTALRYGSFLPVLSWEPGVGWNRTERTSGKAEASMTPTADWLVTVHPSTDVDILASGVDDGQRTWTATATRDWAMSVGSFRRATVQAMSGGRGVQVTVGVQRGLAEDPVMYLDRVTRALAVFGSAYGPYPWPSYSLAITPGLQGGIEYPSHVMQGPGSGGRTTPHEVAHQWFYALVGNDQGRDPWLDEGIASWAEARAEGTLAAFRDKPIPVAARARTGRPMTFWDAHRTWYYRGVYVQTVQALAALGPAEQVDCALRGYVAANAYGVARPADLISALIMSFPDAATVLGRYGITR